MEFILDVALKYWLPILFGGISGVVAVMWAQLKAFKKGILVLLQCQLLEYYYNWIDKGYIPVPTMERITRIYEAYHALGGNGVGTKVFDEMKRLPSNPPQETQPKKDKECCNTCLQNLPDRTS